MNDNKYLQLAIDYSKKSYKAGAFPAGSVLVYKYVSVILQNSYQEC
ncbi:hypothetical protein ISS42_02300 [Candidatus Shapirobacteria bacterium]|nr:hypothetical protein [Candidatus Shapirobacteria bacterium]